ncbi:5'-nucleotidase, lipoprotein e(P4) family [Pustulibacterium marinum]|nr:5'-nucleotidase, lipoprotein e(P4) family [Pustulibacterium marinum]
MMKQIFKISAITITTLLVSCNSTPPPKETHKETTESSLMVDGKLWSSAYQQNAAEYKALCFQAYNIAKLRLDQALQKDANKALAIITDVDETVLDNSPNSVYQGLQGKGYESESWKNWTAKGTADTLAGSKNFFSYAASRGVTVFYVTNRGEDEVEGTLKNLKDFDFPYADIGHILPKTTTSDKSERREKVLKDYEVVLYIGDNLGDFSHDFDSKPSSERNSNVEKASGQFGNKFIVLPNFNYGGWEKAFYKNSYKWTDAQKDSLIKSTMKSY